MDFKLGKRHLKQTLLFERRPLKYLIRKCNHNAKESRKNSHLKENAINIECKGYYLLNIKDNITTNSVKEAIIIVDRK